MNTLIKIQQELKAKKDRYNKFGKYYFRSAESILESLKPLLKEYNSSLIINDEVKQVGDYVFTESTVILRTEKEEYKATAQAGIEKAGGMALPQAFGSSSSYAKKYALGNLFLIDDTEDSDATNTHNKGDVVKKSAKANTKKDSSSAIKDRFKSDKEGTLKAMKTKGKYLTPSQANEIFKEGLATKEELRDVVKK